MKVVWLKIENILKLFEKSIISWNKNCVIVNNSLIIKIVIHSHELRTIQMKKKIENYNFVQEVIALNIKIKLRTITLFKKHKRYLVTIKSLI